MRPAHWALALCLPGTLALSQTAPAIPPIPRFVEETAVSGLQSRFDGEGEYLVGGGVAVFDCDGDGLPEVFVTGGVNPAKFYRNQSARGGPIKLVQARTGLEVRSEERRVGKECRL